ncbi:PepSY domain-containing protein [Alisedimentitalea sp. MJ-SS2]|uniref:PepSY domain-containing protein n=1 Tax=Aliisedimentitalea sp. MJ-SS2 TaxID=3049795 RepID=UPI002915140F|nr:PepSY domain-containing protein [Alisedimentitalea sp. MJ-SS2]MDU8927625.1 PepSY domain-containing protein [Alisedimentitalea sp. MJ-SS2]
MPQTAKALTFFTFLGMAGMAHALTPDKGDILGFDAVSIGQALADQGYELTRFHRAPALIHVTATKGGQRHLMLISPRDGSVISHKTGASRSFQPITTPRISAVPGLAEKLAEQGYEVKRIKDEGYELEAYALRDGQLWELKLDPATGAILSVEAED